MAQLLPTKEVTTPSFIRKKHELDPLFKWLDKASKDAVDTLIDIMMKSEDPKLRSDCADKILKFTLATADQVNKDKMQRLIAEIKIRLPLGGPKELEIETDKYPVVDFHTVRTVE